MKRLVWLGLIALVAAQAQDRHGFSGNGARRGIPRQNFRSGRFRSAGGFNGFRPFGNFYPYAAPLYDDEYDFDSPFSPDPVMEPPPRPIVIRQAPPPVVISAIHNYNFGAPAATPAGNAETTFLVALHDGSRLSATAVWVQGEVVHYIDTDDRARQLPLTAVDRDLTRKLNQERNLNLRLPAPQ